jgi:citrate synthase
MSTARLSRIVGHIAPDHYQSILSKCAASGSDKKDSVTVIDNRTGKRVDIPIKHGTIAATGFESLGLRSYDAGLKNTANTTSRITYIDGDSGILRYRGYPIEELAEKSSFMEVAYLLMYGDLPSKDQLSYWESRIMRHTYVHEDLKGIIKNFRYDAHPMGILISAMSALSTFHPEANPSLSGQRIYEDKELVNKQIHRIIGTVATIAAYSYRHRIGRPYVDPAVSGYSYCENFLYMLDKLSEKDYRPHPVLVRALDILFILHADHEMNCSTAAMRHLASSGVDVYSSVAGAAAALYGPLHGGANEAVLRMLDKIGTKDKVAEFIEQVKTKKALLMGFGHRIYKNYDPRAKIVRRVANEVFEVLGKEPLIELATELERVALTDEYFIKRQLYPNVDFYSGVIYKAMGFPTDYFPVLFAIPRTVGWLAHWKEFLKDPENSIIRPRQVYLGESERHYTPLLQRKNEALRPDIVSSETGAAKRRDAGTIE